MGDSLGDSQENDGSADSLTGTQSWDGADGADFWQFSGRVVSMFWKSHHL